MHTDELPAKPSLWHTPSSTQPVVDSLSLILGPVADSVATEANPALSLLHNRSIFHEIVARLRQTSSGSGTDDLCRWLYDTFQSNISDLQLVVISYIPTLAGVYLCRTVSSKETLAGFEAVFLALYTHEMVIRGGEPCTIAIPNMRISGAVESNGGFSKTAVKGKGVATDQPEPIEVVLSRTLEPYNTIPAQKRGLIVSVALDLYFNNISTLPLYSKAQFCEFCAVWAAGQEESIVSEPRPSIEVENKKDLDNVGRITESKPRPSIEVENKEDLDNVGRIPLSWELLQSVLRILGHCLLGPANPDELKERAFRAAKCVHARATKDFDSKAILASRSLVRLGGMAEEAVPELTLSPVSTDPSELEQLRASVFSN